MATAYTTDLQTTARSCIAEDAERQTGHLNLHGPGLRRLPEELFALTHLRRLALGTAMAGDI